MRPHEAGNRRAIAGGNTLDDDWTTFTVGVPRPLVATRLRGKHPLVRAVDRIEAAVVTMAVLLSVVALPFAGALGTAVYDAGAGPGQAAAGGVLLWAGVTAFAVATIVVTHRICDRARRARWDKGLSQLAEAGDGTARDQT
ncbi:hypothetical protein [Mycolicibacterium parafortuitum]|uniref:Putative membrane protein n=1 Tax=Mycolicibacterium parafortuitum TaxID=39692 RepID=A0A375YD93_MYCPF|nr:hypothetical protein [Mycolicibacterium parafortuitum]ORB31060.1 hypothetical protein BST38_07060 [Mycolicibacterium parafortuitum]SRX79087.1 putative membrane protein [Mycolicibacterium parafortuitum]